VLAVGGSRGAARVLPFGRLTYDPESPDVTLATLYDLASLTKVVATTPAAMVLVDEGRLSLDSPVSSYIPAFSGGSKGVATTRHLLSHSAGLPAWAPLYREVRGKDAVVSRVTAMEQEFEPGTRSQYGDLAMIVLGGIIERVSAEPLEAFVESRVLRPLGMEKTLFRPSRERKGEIAPTEEDHWRGRLLWGEVHDENAYAMAGVAGHAGLFGTAGDLARFAQVMLNEGQVGSTPWVTPRTIREFTTRAGVPGSSRALGWDTPGSDPFLGRGWSESSYGHTGLTGTLLWIDPEKDLFVVLLTNRVYPSRNNEAFSDVRREVCERLLSSVGGRRVASRSHHVEGAAARKSGAEAWPGPLVVGGSTSLVCVTPVRAGRRRCGPAGPDSRHD
jgi:CubicO group peptidase (beta-lactamase class C family)